MREILFRGRRVDKGGWVEGNYVLDNRSNSHWITSTWEDGERNYLIIPETVGQFTGREDAQINGNKVWENDIIENCDTKELQIVFWDDNESAWYCRYIEDPSRVVSLSDSLGNLNKVIGNIHDSPDNLPSH